MKADPLSRDRGIDYWVTSPAGKLLALDDKADQRAAETGNVALELFTVWREQGPTAGWVYTSESGLIRYWSVDTRAMFFIDVEGLRKWVLEHAQRPSFKLGAAVNSAGGKVSHVSVNLLVPMAVWMRLPFVCCVDLHSLRRSVTGLPKDFDINYFMPAEQALRWAANRNACSIPCEGLSEAAIRSMLEQRVKGPHVDKALRSCNLPWVPRGRVLSLAEQLAVLKEQFGAQAFESTVQAMVAG